MIVSGIIFPEVVTARPQLRFNQMVLFCLVVVVFLTDGIFGFFFPTAEEHFLSWNPLNFELKWRWSSSRCSLTLKRQFCVGFIWSRDPPQSFNPGLLTCFMWRKATAIHPETPSTPTVSYRSFFHTSRSLRSSGSFSLISGWKFQTKTLWLWFLNLGSYPLWT